jgi:tetratricopeptide (TPR) repeat protein
MKQAGGGPMAKKKLTRKELLKQPDEILTMSTRLFNLSVTYRYQLIAVLAGVIAIVAAITFVRYSSDRTEKAGFAQLQQNRQKYEAALQEKGPQAAYLQVQQDYETLLERYGGTRAGQLGKIAYASICYRGGDAQKALTLYRDALDHFEDPFIKNQIWIGMGYAYESLNNLEEAVEMFEKVDMDSDAFQKGEALYNLGRIYAALGREDKSREAYEKILSENAATIYLEMVKEQMGG